MPKVRPNSPLSQVGGRKPANDYVVWCQARARDPKRQMALIRVSRDPESPHFLGVNKHLDAYAWGLPVQSIQTADVTPGAALTGEVVVRQLLAALPLLLAGHPALAAGLTGQQAVDAEFTVEE